MGNEAMKKFQIDTLTDIVNEWIETMYKIDKNLFTNIKGMLSVSQDLRKRLGDFSFSKQITSVENSLT